MNRLNLVLFLTYIVCAVKALGSSTRWPHTAARGLIHSSSAHVSVLNSYGVQSATLTKLSMMSDDNIGRDDLEGSDDKDDVETSLEVNEEGVVYRKSSKTGIPFSRAKADDRENMPYKTYILLDGKARNAEHIATLRLGALTACGDLLDLGEKGLYEVVRVSFVYKWEGPSGFAVTGKRLYCKPARRRWAQSIESLQ